MAIKQLRQFRVECDRRLDSLCFSYRTPNKYSVMEATCQDELFTRLKTDGTGWSIQSVIDLKTKELFFNAVCPSCREKEERMRNNLGDKA